MDCVLKKSLKEEHENINNPLYAPGGIAADMTHICPLMGKQICYWCCQHIYHVSQPMTRVVSSDNNPGYAEKIAKLTDREDLDDVWSTCSQCGRGGSKGA